MSVGEICNREVIIVHRDETVQKAAKLMRQHHVGDVVVVENQNGVSAPVGIVTDRDVVVEIVATGLDQATMTVGDIMAQEWLSKEFFDLSKLTSYEQKKEERNRS